MIVDLPRDSDFLLICDLDFYIDSSLSSDGVRNFSSDSFFSMVSTLESMKDCKSETF